MSERQIEEFRKGEEALLIGEEVDQLAPAQGVMVAVIGALLLAVLAGSLYLIG